MNRRHFLQRKAPALRAPAAAQTGPSAPVSSFANKVLPTGLARTTSTLAPYAGPWGYDQAAHLLRRSLFGPTRAQIVAAAGATLPAVLNGLFTVPAPPAPPLTVVTTDSVPVGQTWTTQPYNNGLEGERRDSLRNWWAGQILNQGVALAEKMTLFWHNHFVIDIVDVNDARMSYEYCRLLRQHALGNFRQLTKDVTVTPAMLQYLNGNENRAGAPNENYGRELLELFTVGRGPLIGPGNYTHYTEADVQAAAQVLTGWRDARTPLGSYFTANLHDATTKQFSGAFGNRTIANQGDQEYKALVDMIFQQAETARFLVRKLYRWFVYYVIDAQVEADIIGPLAALLVQSNFEVAPVLRALLASEHFFDAANAGCLLKSPFDFTVGFFRQMQVAFPPASAVVTQYDMWKYLNFQTRSQQQDLGAPPNVAGWAAYYQTPQYHELWINSATLQLRNKMTDLFVGTGYRPLNGAPVAVDAVALVQSLPAATAADCNLLIAELTKLLLPIPLTANQLVFLKAALLPGLPDFEWTDEWTQYLATPTANAKAALATKLRALLRALLGLAEYQLS